MTWKDSRCLVCVSRAQQCVCIREARFHLDNKGPVLLAQEELDLISMAAVKWPTYAAGMPQMNQICFL